MSAQQRLPLALRFLAKGGKISIASGVLMIESPDGSPVANDWVKQHGPEILRDLLKVVGKSAYTFIRYSAGNYHSYAGVTLHFLKENTYEDAYCIFNANLTYQRNTKGKRKGDPLPKNHFSVGKGSHFHKFWLKTGLALPASTTSYHGRMGCLKGIYFEADTTPGKSNRLVCDSIKPLELSYEQIYRSYQAAYGELLPQSPFAACR